MEQNRAKFSFNFEKKTINKTVISFMEKSVLTEDQNNWVSQMAQGKKLKKGDANMLLQCLFAAIIPEGQEDEEETQFFKIHKKSSVKMRTAKAKTARPQATKGHQIGRTKIDKPQQTKCANSIKKENAGMAKSAETNIPNSAKNLSNTGV